jgi:outer membrane lipoprotein-sorting protein
MRKKFAQLSLALLLTATNDVYADDVQEGLEIAKQADDHNRGWRDMSAELTMVLSNPQGERSERSLRMQSFEVQGEGDMSLVVFDKPADVKGSALLSHAHLQEQDDQWLYFPAFKRVKRISSANKSGPFMGSEFAYEDMAPWELEKFRYRYKGDEKIGGLDVYVLEMTPKYENSGYTKQVARLDKEHYRPILVEFYDRKGALLKTLSYSDYQRYNGKYWRSSKMDMVNHLTGKKTQLIWKEYVLNAGLSQQLFDKDQLTRVR